MLIVGVVFGHCSFYCHIIFSVFRRNATHCISPYANVVCVCVCLYVCMPRLWTPGKRFEIELVFFSKLHAITPDIICKSLTQLLLQIPRWRTKWRPWNTIIGCNSAIYECRFFIFHWIVHNDSAHQLQKLTQIRLQIPRWRTKSRRRNTIIGCISAIN